VNPAGTPAILAPQQTVESAKEVALKASSDAFLAPRSIPLPDDLGGDSLYLLRTAPDRGTTPPPQLERTRRVRRAGYGL